MTQQETVRLSNILFNPINYLIISKLRKGGIYLKTDFKDLLGETVFNLSAQNLKQLKENNIIAEIKVENEDFILLKTDIKFIKTIPKYLILDKKFEFTLPESLTAVGDKILKTPDKIKEIFKRWFA